MTFHPISTYAERDGNTVRLHPGPVNLPSRGQSVYQAVKITRHWKGGQWIVSLDEKTVTISATNADYPAAIISAPKTANIFGDIIDPTKISGDTLTFQITANGAAQDAQGHWHFSCAAIDGVDLGVFWHKWQRMFGGGCVIAGSTITLDITAAKAAGEPINLDPTVINAGTSAFVLESPPRTETWAAARAGTNVVGCRPGNAWADVGADGGGGQFVMDRYVASFNTSAYPAVASAALKGSGSQADSTVLAPFDVHVLASPYVNGLSPTPADWTALLGGVNVAMVTPATGTGDFGSTDLTAHYASTVAFTVSLIEHAHDAANVPPAGSYDLYMGSCYLEITLPPPPPPPVLSGPPAGSLMMMGVGR